MVSPDVRPHTEAISQLEPEGKWPLNKELYFTVFFRLREAASWAAAGHLVATGQLRLSPPDSVANLLGLNGLSLFKFPSPQSRLFVMTVHTSFPHVLHITAHTLTHTAWTFDLLRGHLTAWRRDQDPKNILATPLELGLYRALTNNDAGGDKPTGVRGSQGGEWRNKLVHLAREYPVQRDRTFSRWVEKRLEDGSEVVEITTTSRIAPPMLGWGINVTSTYRFMANDTTGIAHDRTGQAALHIHVQAKASGPWLPGSFPRFGLVTGLRNCHAAKWFGRGPGECYRDRKESQLMGTYTRTIDDLFTNYEVPQENGNRTDVRWVEFGSEEAGSGLTDDEAGGLGAGHGKPYRLLRARFGDLEGASLSAGEYTTRELGAARHPFELEALAKKGKEAEGHDNTVEMHLDWAHHGLGTGSCGPQTLPEHSLSQKGV